MRALSPPEITTFDTFEYENLRVIKLLRGTGQGSGGAVRVQGTCIDFVI